MLHYLSISNDGNNNEKLIESIFTKKKVKKIDQKLKYTQYTY